MKNAKSIRTILYIAFCLAIPFTGISKDKPLAKKPGTEIHFIEDAWSEALKQAAAQHKYIFVDAYATWCGPCKMLKATTFKDAKVATFFNQNFVNISIDMEKGVGPQLAQQWRLEAYPTLIIFNPQGKAVLGTVGYIKADELLKFAKQGLAKK
jgi:thiol:disulfide interchange protein